MYAAVDTLGYLLSVVVTPANAQERAQVAELAAQVQDVTGETVELAYVDAGSTGPDAAAAAASQGIHRAVVKLEEAQGPNRGFVLLPRHWVVEGTQSQYLQSALDVQASLAHDRAHWVAQPARGGEPTASSSAG